MACQLSMLVDKARTKGFLRAILKTVKPGDVVLALGSDTGILAYFACISGARRACAIEQRPIIELARAICRHNGFHYRVVFLNDWSTHVDPPEPVDVIVTETIGNVGFEEKLRFFISTASHGLSQVIGQARHLLLQNPDVHLPLVTCERLGLDRLVLFCVPYFDHYPLRRSPSSLRFSMH